MNKVEMEYFFKYIATMYSKNGLCDNCPMKAECSATTVSVELCYDNFLKALDEVTAQGISARDWVLKMSELQGKDKTTDWAYYEGSTTTTVVFDVRNQKKESSCYLLWGRI